MADRAVNDGELGVPREVFELDKDERWQARLEEARARREIALREKAAGNAPPRKRLKPWEIEAAGKPAIEPIIQEREDNGRVDFADRVDTIREAVKKKELSPPPRHHNWARAVDTPVPEPIPPKPPKEPALVEAHKPPPPDEFDEILTNLPLPKSVPKDVPLVLPDAPDVRELASRYAATLVPDEEPIEQAEPLPEPEPELDTESALEKPRRTRPFWLALAVLGLAMLPFTTEAPPLEKGPPMPRVSGFVFEPALGVTWSMMQRPFQTRSGEWMPQATRPPIGPVDPADWRPADFARQIPGIGSPESGTDRGSVAWEALRPAKLGQVTRLLGPPPIGVSPNTNSGSADAIVAPSDETLKQSLPSFGNIPAKPRPPRIQASQPDTAPSDANLTKPPEPAPITPLRVTILSPARADQKIAADIAADLPRRGHEVVQVREVGYAISARNLRYFFENDRAEAARLAELYEAELRDFTWYRPRPSTGTTELWLAGKASAITNPVRTARPLVQTAPALEPPEPMRVMPAPTPKITAKNQDRSLLGWLFGRHQAQGPDVSNSDGDAVSTAQSSEASGGDDAEDTSDTDGATASETDANTSGSDTDDASSTSTSGGSDSDDTSATSTSSGSDSSESDSSSTDGASDDTSSGNGASNNGSSGNSKSKDD